jgi:hypothetical protein
VIGKANEVEQDMSSKRSKMVAGVSVRLLDDGDADYDELLREAPS